MYKFNIKTQNLQSSKVLYIICLQFKYLLVILCILLTELNKFRRLSMNTKIIEYLNCHKYMNFNELLFSYIDESGYKDSEIYKKVDIDRNFIITRTI